MSAALISTPILLCAVCDKEMAQEPTCFVCDCGCAFTLVVLSSDDQLGIRVVVPELPVSQ